MDETHDGPVPALPMATSVVETTGLNPADADCTLGEWIQGFWAFVTAMYGFVFYSTNIRDPLTTL